MWNLGSGKWMPLHSDFATLVQGDMNVSTAPDTVAVVTSGGGEATLGGGDN
jgi:hypothetical protein